MTNGDEVSITCGEAASIVDRIRGFFEPSSILVFDPGADVTANRIAAAGDDNADASVADESMSGAPVRSRDASLGDDPGINGNCGMNRIDITAQQGTQGALDGTRRYAAVSFHIEGVSHHDS